jgi:predicted DNA-binding transcriptional regulator AlpA
MDITQLTGDTLIICRAEDLQNFAESLLKCKPETLVKQEPQTEQPISQPEAIKFLGKSRQTLIKWRKSGTIKAHTLGGRVYYLKSELLAAIQR